MPDAEVLADLRVLRSREGLGQFHSPENLAKSTSIEAAEILECFQWLDLAICVPRHAPVRGGIAAEHETRSMGVRGLTIGSRGECCSASFGIHNDRRRSRLVSSTAGYDTALHLLVLPTTRRPAPASGTATGAAWTSLAASPRRTPVMAEGPKLRASELTRGHALKKSQRRTRCMSPNISLAHDGMAFVKEDLPW